MWSMILVAIMIGAVLYIVSAFLKYTTFFTLKHMQKLTHEKIVIDQAVNDFEHRYKMMREKRQENEKRFDHLKRDRSGLETFLEKLRKNLADQEEKNRDLEKLII